MSKEFYTYVGVKYGKIFYRGYEIDELGKKKRIQGKVAYKPTLYLESEEGQSKSLFGKTLKAKEFDSISQSREFVKEYSDVMPIYGYHPNRMEYDFIAKNFPETMEVLVSDLKCIGFDIETSVGTNSAGGVPDPYTAPEPITHIAFQDHLTDKVTCYTTAKVSMSKTQDAEYTIFPSETELLKAIIKFVEVEDPDIIYGFYSDFFDVPYIINRINRVLGPEAANKLSPFGVIDSREIEVNDAAHISYTIVGRTHFDTQAMYKKFVLQKQESYSLDNLAKVELGVGKLENPCGSFKEFSEHPDHVDTFAKYNVIDTTRLTQLDKKTGLLSLAVALAYLMKCNFEDVFSPVRYWECYIMATLRNENTFVSVTKQHVSGKPIPGAYVEEPVPGFYDWVVSIDATALYPSIMKALNLSPETFIGMRDGITVEDMLSGKTTVANSNLSGDYTLAANGAMFHKEFPGIVSRLVDNVLDGRRIAKNEMLEAKQKYVDTKDEIYKKKADLANVLQGALKVAANSFYGVFLQPGFMFYDPRFGEAITLTGQYIIVKVGDHCNKRFNEFFKTNIRYTIYRDTDSCFFTLGNIVDKYWKDQPDLKIVDALDKLMETKLRKFIDESTEEIALTQNHYNKTIFFKRENICSGGFWMGKKKYALKVYDSEGVRYPEGDYKIMGIEVVRSSTPMMARTALKDCVIFTIDKDINKVREIVDKTRQDFMVAPVENIAFPRSANNLVQYSDESNIYTKGCPIAVRASLLYNHHIKKYDIEDKYPPIKEGEKIKFVYTKEPNHFKENIIAFTDVLPPEFKLDGYIDRVTQFDKVFMAPLDKIMTAVGWKLEEEQTLDEFFG